MSGQSIQIAHHKFLPEQAIRIAHEIFLNVSKEAKDYLIDKGYDEKYGARPFRRAVERYIEDPLAEAILRGDIKKVDPIEVVVEEDEIKFVQEQSSSEVTSN